jgi:hypothetical protein
VNKDKFISYFSNEIIRELVRRQADSWLSFFATNLTALPTGQAGVKQVH